jgi:hypothetical protein
MSLMNRSPLICGGICQNPVTVRWGSYKGLTYSGLTNPWIGLEPM